ncbi:MAG: flagellar motor protein MotB [Ferrimonas sp.]
MDQRPPKKAPAGSPAWMGTFADLMSLLMCFFVLLLSFSEMDVIRFKQVAGSMKYAFGIQNRIEAADIPKGTSVIAMEFRPGRPEPTPIDVIQQHTVEFTKESLHYQDGDSSEVGGQKEGAQSQAGSANAAEMQQQSAESQAQQTENNAQQDENQAGKSLSELAKRIEEHMHEQIEDGAIEVEALGQQLIIRIMEQGAFPAGSAFLQPKFRPVIRQIGELLNEVPGIVTVSGHSDTGKTRNELYGSNWELSSQRAVAVGHQLIEVPNFDESRMRVQGLAEYDPLDNNMTWAGRKRNRRVEIAIEQGKASMATPISAAGMP